MTRRLGAVLAGGQSRRFGSDKAAAMLDGQSLLDRAVAGLTGQVTAVVVCGRPPGLTDRPPGQLGPLAGLNAALHHAAARGFDGVVSIPCDLAEVPQDLAAKLAAAGPVSYAAGSPVIGLWPTALAGLLDRHLGASGDRSMRHWIAACGATACEVGPIANLNTLAELAALVTGR